jgi:hypothetical protein
MDSVRPCGDGGAVSNQIDDLKVLIEQTEKCSATHIESAPIKERYEDRVIWEGVVETFQLEGHATSARAYAWVSPASSATEPEYTVVLGVPPVNSANDAVKAAAVEEVTRLLGIAEELSRKDNPSA